MDPHEFGIRFELFGIFAQVDACDYFFWVLGEKEMSVISFGLQTNDFQNIPEDDPLVGGDAQAAW